MRTLVPNNLFWVIRRKPELMLEGDAS